MEGTFWAGVRPDYALFDPEEMEALFPALQRRPGGGQAGAADSPPAASGGEASPAAPASGRRTLAVLDLRRATGMGIRMARTRVPWREVPAAVAALDRAALSTADDVAAVLQCLPTSDEAAALQSFVGADGGGEAALADAELFAWQLARVPRAEARLRALLFALEAPAALDAAAATLEWHAAAAAELRGSATFASVLKLVLAAGNFLNHGTRLGQAPGFRLRVLQKLGVRKGWGVRHLDACLPARPETERLALLLSWAPPCAGHARRRR